MNAISWKSNLLESSMTLDQYFTHYSPGVKIGTYFVGAFLGMLCHYMKKRLQDNVTFSGWYFKELPATFFALLFAAVTSLPSISTLDLGTTSALAFLTMGFSMGFMSDSLFNRGVVPGKGLEEPQSDEPKQD